MTGADRILAVFEQRGGSLSGSALAVAAGMRKADALAALRSDPRFVREGMGRASRWHVVSPRSLTAADATVRWDCDEASAAEIIEWLLAQGFVVSQNGNGRVVPTELGVMVSVALRGRNA